MKPIKLGIIGCGIAARELHWPVLKEMTDKFEIAAVCNHTEEKAKSFSQMVGNVPYVLDYNEILNMKDIDAVDIILPIELNFETVKAAMKANKHIIVEKPLASNLKDAENMVELEKTYPKVAMVAENFRYRKAVEKAGNYMASGKIGKPYAVFWNKFDKVDKVTNLYANTSWRINHKYPGGFVTDAGIHNIAALRDLLGDIKGTGIFTKSANPELGQIDSMSLQFSSPQDISGVVNLFFSSDGYKENTLKILGTQGCITIDGDVLTVSKGDSVELQEVYPQDDGYRGEFEDFYKAISEGKKSKATFYESYLDLKMLIDAYNLEF
ncbi:MAG: Gfo/Idh/MocA family oxidoreductase [Bacillota bacterium]|nr:Gfo/Idh/MocA family oxidoreductase [Bacillota bacterium]